MMGVVWTRNALQRLREAYYFLLQHDKDAAETAVGKIRHSISLLRNNPQLGRPVLELPGSNTRELIVSYGASGYVVLYELEDSRVVIMNLRHQKELGYQ